MNTEAFNTLRLIRAAINELQMSLNDVREGTPERRLIENVLVNLFEQENTIILDSLEEMVNKINSSNAKLKELIGEMERSVDNIARFSNTVKKVSSAIGTLVDIASKAITAGIA